jgi:broad specificity phosphatase PhoE
MCQLIVLREGLTRWEAEKRLRGRVDVPLAPEGEAEVKRSAHELSTLTPAAIYHGPDQAGRQTAELLREAADVPVRELGDLAEMNLGLWEGLLAEEVKQRHPRVYRQWLDDPERVEAPEGETMAQGRERVEKLLRSVSSRHPHDTVVLVVPPLLGALVRWVLGAGELGALVRGTLQGAPWQTYEVEPPGNGR